MSRHELVSQAGMRTARVRTVAGLATAVVPVAIFVHLAAEAVSIGAETFSLPFLLRHIYLGALFAAALFAFGRTVGTGATAAERRRRCALITAQLRSRGSGASVLSLAAANMSFFALSQLAEGVPIASGDACLGLAAAVAGSLLAAFMVSIFGRSIALAALAAIAIVLRAAAAPPPALSFARPAAPRRAAAMFSLFVPNRPPPTHVLV